MNLSQINENIIKIKKNGQLTLPAKLREFFPWLNQDSLIQAKPTAQGLLLQPLKKHKLNSTQEEETTGRLIKRLAKLAKYDKGSVMSTVEFLRIDRRSH